MDCPLTFCFLPPFCFEFLWHSLLQMSAMLENGHHSWSVLGSLAKTNLNTCDLLLWMVKCYQPRWWRCMVDQKWFSLLLKRRILSALFFPFVSVMWNGANPWERPQSNSVSAQSSHLFSSHGMFPGTYHWWIWISRVYVVQIAIS